MHKQIENNVLEINSISSRVASVILRETKKYKVYAPTPDYEGEGKENFYDKVSEAIDKNQTHYYLIIRDYDKCRNIFILNTFFNKKEKRK